MTDGRIYLKTGDTKSAFYIAGADVTVTPGPESLYFRFSGEPARTDHAARTTGLFSARGTFSNGKLDMDLELEKSPVNELGGLLRGPGSGITERWPLGSKYTAPYQNLASLARLTWPMSTVGT